MHMLRDWFIYYNFHYTISVTFSIKMCISRLPVKIEFRSFGAIDYTKHVRPHVRIGLHCQENHVCMSGNTGKKKTHLFKIRK